jgi:hypothetical protein
MPIGEHRSGRVGILATIVLMVSVVLFISSLFYLTTNNPWNKGSILEEEKYLTKSVSDKESEDPYQQELNLTMAVADLEKAGCVFTVYIGEYNEISGTKIEYSVFKEEAIKRKIVYIAEKDKDITVLLIEKKGRLYEWSP